MIKRCTYGVFLAGCYFYSLFGVAQCPLPVPTIRLTQPNTTAVAYGSFCQGEQVQLNAGSTQAGVRYQWKRDGNNIAGATNPTLLAGQNGLYTVSIESVACPAASSSDPVAIKPENCTPTGKVRIRGGSLEEDINTNLALFQSASIRISLYTYPSDRNRFPLQVTGYIYRKRDNALIRTVSFLRNSRIELVWKRPPACSNDSTQLQDIYYFYNLPNEPAVFNDPDGYIITTDPICCRESTENVPGEMPVSYYLEFSAHASYNLSQPESTFAPEYYIPTRLEACAGKPISFGSTIQPSANLTTFLYTFTDVYTSQPADPRYRPVPMKAGYSPANFTGNTGNGLVINSQTGVISGIPERPGLYMYTVRGEFFQNGVRRGEILRELQLLVKDCDNAKPTLVASVVNNPSKPADLRICAGGSLQLNATGVSTGGQLQWQRNGDPITGAVSSTLLVQQAGMYTLSVIKREACPPLVLSEAISVSVTSPTVSVSVTGGGTCPEDPIQLSASTSVTTGTYSWYRDEVIVPQAVGATYLATGSGAYRVLLTDVMGCTATSATLPVRNSAAAPRVQILTEQRTGLSLCVGAGRHFRADASVPVQTYQWFRDNAAISNVTSASFAPAQTGSYTVRITAAGGCTAVSSPLVLATVEEPPSISATASASAICPGGTATVAVIQDNSLSYQWLRDGQPITGATSASYVASVGGQYTVVLRDPASCTAVSTPSVLTTSSPAAVQIAGSRELCRNTTTPLVVTASPGSFRYQWLLNGTAVASATSATLTAQTAGTYQVQLTDATGCTAVSPDWPITAIDQITVQFSAIGPVCADVTTLALTGTPAGGTFSGPGVSGNLFSPVRAGSGQHVLTYAVQGPTTCQRGTAQQSVTVRALPVVSLGPAIGLTKGSSIELTGPAGTGYQYRWEPPVGLSDPSIRNPLASPDQSTTYQVRVRDELGCEGTGSIRVEVGRRLYIPDAFTPNGDGSNDVWQLFGVAAYPDIDVTIFNRWGTVIFHATGYQQPFAGLDLSGQPLPGGLYTYVIRHDPHQTLTGTVLLLR